jgi:hypothetical protein
LARIPEQFDVKFQEEFERVVNDKNPPEANDKFTPNSFNDTYLNMELALPRSGGEVEFAKGIKHLHDKIILPIGTANDNPIFFIGHKARKSNSLTATVHPCLLAASKRHRREPFHSS